MRMDIRVPEYQLSRTALKHDSLTLFTVRDTQSRSQGKSHLHAETLLIVKLQHDGVNMTSTSQHDRFLKKL